MALHRHFLDWDGPALPRAVHWLHSDAARQQTGAPLADRIIVVPAGAASRRLLELLLESEDAALEPPTIVTPGDLPELLYQPHRPLADALSARLARVWALQQAERAILNTVAPHAPAASDWAGWWSLAGQLETLAQTLAAEGLRLAEVPARAAAQAVDLTGEARWQALAALEQGYADALATLDLADPHLARLDAIAQQRCRSDRPIVLLGMADLNRVVAAMLAQLDVPIVSLIHAPQAHAAGFDALGAINVGYWQQQTVDIDDAMLHVVDRPSDQAQQVLAALAEHASERYAADQITVGLGDERLVETFRRSLELAGLPVRYAAGRPMGQTRPAMLLGALARFMAGRRFNDFAELLRHPDLEGYLHRQLEDGATRSAIDHWLTLLDRYAAEHLQGRIDGRWLGDADEQAQLKNLWEQVVALMPVDTSETRPLPAWSKPIAQAMQAVYGELELQRHAPQDEPMIRTLQAVGEALRELAALDPDAPTTPTLTASQAIQLALGRLHEQSLPEPGGEPAIELTGYLHLQLDDAPLAIITSMNEGAVPASQTADAFLPNSLRAALGMADNARRYARDLFMLQAILKSRPSVTLIAGRRAAEGDPLAPSRLLLACDDASLVRRIEAYYDESAADPAPRAPAMLTPGKHDQFLIPPPLFDEPPLDTLSVTAFRAYLACPYRFYLRYVRKLRGLDDGAVEMDAMAFGTLAHDVLETFGRSKLADVAVERDIADYLSTALDSAAQRRFGQAHRPALRLQIEQLRERLRQLAARQAEWRAEGWRIVQAGVERELEAVLTVDGEPFTLVGKIDRVDYHPEQGYRILDYKTGDTAAKPEQTHCRTQDGQRVWVDLQLPLYLSLCEPRGLRGPIEVGYINLPKKLSDVGLTLATWSSDELAEAFARRDHVIRQLRGQVFWPPSEPPSFADEFVGLCADRALDRQQIIQRSGHGQPRAEPTGSVL